MTTGCLLVYNTLMPETNKLENKNNTEPESGWNYSPESETGFGMSGDEQNFASVESVSWTASEYVAHDKTVLWYVAVSVFVTIFAGLIYFFDGSKSLISPILIVSAGIIFMITASRKPSELDYLIDDAGIHVGKKLYAFSQFKSFALVQEGPIVSLVFIPLQRFMPSLTVYFDPNDQDKIVNALSMYLPVESRKLDIIDNLMRKIRF